MRNFVFDDGQVWQAELTRLTCRVRGTASVGVLFWAVDAPDQRVVGRLQPRGLMLSDRQLAEALRQAIRGITADATIEA